LPTGRFFKEGVTVKTRFIVNSEREDREQHREGRIKKIRYCSLPGRGEKTTGFEKKKITKRGGRG